MVIYDTDCIIIVGKPISVTKEHVIAAKAKVFIVNQEYQANHKVFFVDQEYQQKNHQLISPGELVKQEYQADIKVFIVNQEYQASIKIMRKNFPK